MHSPYTITAILVRKFMKIKNCDSTLKMVSESLGFHFGEIITSLNVSVFQVARWNFHPRCGWFSLWLLCIGTPPSPSELWAVSVMRTCELLWRKAVRGWKPGAVNRHCHSGWSCGIGRVGSTIQYPEKRCHFIFAFLGRFLYFLSLKTGMNTPLH